MNGTEYLKVKAMGSHNPIFWAIVPESTEISLTRFFDTEEAAQSVLDSWRNAGDENLKDMVFKLANRLALAGEGDAAVGMHRIHNRL
jgi:hypothetical protein